MFGREPGKVATLGRWRDLEHESVMKMVCRDSHSSPRLAYLAMGRQSCEDETKKQPCQHRRGVVVDSTRPPRGHGASGCLRDFAPSSEAISLKCRWKAGSQKSRSRAGSKLSSFGRRSVSFATCSAAAGFPSSWAIAFLTTSAIVEEGTAEPAKISLMSRESAF